MNSSKKVILMAIILLCFNVSMIAQSISLKLNNVPIGQAMDELKQKSGYSFVFESSDIDTEKIVSVDATNLESIISQILSDQTVTYQIKGKNIVVKKSPVVKTNRTVTGTVVDQLGEPIIGATIMVSGDKANGTITDIDGNFSIDVNDKQSLEISYLGYIKQIVSIKNKTSLMINLVEDTKTLDEVIVVGYTSQKKGLLTGAISSMKVSEEMNSLPLTSAGDVMIGKMAGVSVSSTNGIPGSQPTIQIRTNSTFGGKSQQVAYVIDGVVRGSGDFNNLSPNEIEDITVLKDAASAAIYGSRSAGGVILVTTKRGKEGKPKFNYSYSYAIDSRTKNIKLTDAVETGSWYNRINGDADPATWRWSDEELEYYKGVNNGWGYDQLKSVYRSPNTQTHNFSVTGGSNKIKYFSGLSYLDQKGFLDPQSYKKLNFRLNLTVDLTDNLEFFAGMGITNNKTSSVPFEGAESLYSKLLVWQPDQPVFTDGGQLADYGWIANVGGETGGLGGYSKNEYMKPQMVFNLTYKIPFIEGLSAKAAYSSTWANTRSSDFQHNYDMAILPKSGAYNHIIDTKDKNIIGWKKSNKGNEYLRKSSDWAKDYQLNLQLNYNRTFNHTHKVQGAFVFEKSESSGSDVYGRRQNFPVYLTDQFWAASGASKDTDGGGGSDWKNGRASFIGQFNYSYADKYLVSFSFREDGSMKFSKDERWGFFPAASLGWVISEEGFFNKKFVDFLKLRASVGLTGDDQVGGWQWQESYGGSSSAYFGRNPREYKGISYGGIVNPNLTWEKSLSYNIGADIHFADNWNASFDYWYKDTYDILGPRSASVPTSFPLAMPDENYGKMKAQGFDFEIGYRNQFGDFGFNTNLTMSYGWNEVIRQDYAQNAKFVEIPEGKSSTYETGYRVHSIIRTQEDLDRFNAQYPNYKINGLSPELGMLVYKDLSGPNGIPDGTIDSWDQDVIIDNNHPFNFGLNLGGTWKDLAIDMMFTGQLGAYKKFMSVTEKPEWNRGWKEWHDNEWSTENPKGWMPKRITHDGNKTYTQNSNFWWKKNNFLRLKYLTISYSIPQKVIGHYIDNLKVFVTGTNLFCLNSFKYWDPEIGNGIDYPLMRTFNFGASITF